MKNEELKTTKKGKTTKEKSSSKKNAETKKEVSKSTKKKELPKKVTPKVEEIVEETKVEETITKTTPKKINTKTSDLFLILGLVAVVVLGFLVMRDKNAGPSYELPLTLTGDSGLQQLTYEEYQTKIDNKDEFVVILERATCSHCVAFLPVAEKFASDNELPMYYVDTDTFTEEDWEGFEKSISYLRKANGNWGTPTTVVQSGSETVDYIEGQTTADKLLDLYNKYFDMGE